jgi:hypothetical protein
MFCGWDFPCSHAPDRLVLHSIVGAITIDVVLTIIFVKIIGKLSIERLGIFGFSNVKTNAAFFVSAAIGSLSHVFVNTRLSRPSKNAILYQQSNSLNFLCRKCVFLQLDQDQEKYRRSRSSSSGSSRDLRRRRLARKKKAL